VLWIEITPLLCGQTANMELTLCSFFPVSEIYEFKKMTEYAKALKYGYGRI